MHHKRLPELNATLASIARLSGSSRLSITVAQYLDASEAANAAATAELIRKVRGSVPFKLMHAPLVRRLNGSSSDTSYSTNAMRYGTKLNSCLNLMHGLDTLFTARPQLRAALVVEDDVYLAVDALEFFDLSASIIASTSRLEYPSKVVLATGFCYHRPDHVDYFSTTGLPSRFLAGRPDRYRREPLNSFTIRTLAWLVTRDVYEGMRHDLVDGPEPMLALPVGAPLHRSLAGCDYCENFCYDHYLEWRWRHASFICPEAIRSAANFSGGMTEHAGILQADGDVGYNARVRAGTDQLNQLWTPASRFVDDAARRAAARTLHRLAWWAVPMATLMGALSCGRRMLCWPPRGVLSSPIAAAELGWAKTRTL